MSKSATTGTKVSAAQGPQNDTESMVHALNIHGTFFERYCEQVIAATPPWTVRATNYPIAHPGMAPTDPRTSSELDIRAEMPVGRHLLTLLLECKKHNPELATWVFFLPTRPTDRLRARRVVVEATPHQRPARGWEVHANLVQAPWPMPHGGDGREVRETYQDQNQKKNDSTKTKTANDTIWKGAYQAALATQAILDEEVTGTRAHLTAYPTGPSKYQTQIIMPVIVTTAHLLMCDFDPRDIDPRTGEIPLDRARMQSCPYMVYDYPLPRALQARPQPLGPVIEADGLELFARLHIIVVQSASFAQFLQDMAADAPRIFPSQHI